MHTREVEVAFINHAVKCTSYKVLKFTPVLLTEPPIILHICRESREEGLKKYKACLQSQQDCRRVIYINPLTDMLFLRLVGVGAPEKLTTPGITFAHHKVHSVLSRPCRVGREAEKEIFPWNTGTTRWKAAECCNHYEPGARTDRTRRHDPGYEVVFVIGDISVIKEMSGGSEDIRDCLAKINTPRIVGPMGPHRDLGFQKLDRWCTVWG